jgi:hydrogenase-4 component E
MSAWTDSVLVVVILLDLLLLGSSRLGSCIRLAALQGVALGALVLAQAERISAATLVLVVASVVLKAAVFPWLLQRSLREANVRREIEPIVGFTPSLLIGIVALAASIWLGSHVTLPGASLSQLAVPAAAFTVLTGLFVIVSRRKAVVQVLGYLVFENGIFAFGIALSADAPLAVELGVLLDAFVAVFVMGITIFHINREFDSIDTARLSSLRDWEQP